MKFAPSTIGALAVRVLLLRPNHTGNQPIRVDHRLDTSVDEGRTTLEERRPQRAALHITQKCTLQLITTEIDDWRKGTAALNTDYVAMPLWIDALPVARWAERIYEGEKVINFNEATGAFAIYDRTGIPGTPPHPMLAPLLVGRWNKRPPARALTSKLAEVDVELRYAAPYSCRIGINSHGAAWIATPDWTSPPTDASNYGLELVQPNPVVEPALDRSNSAARWMQEADFTFTTRLEIRQALTWFVAKRGSWQSWAGLPAWLQPGTATAQTPNSYTARFASDSLSFTYISGAIATSRIGFLQEIDAPTQPQALPPEVYLYRVRYVHDTANPELRTNYDSPLVATEGTYQPRQAIHKQLRLSLRPQDESFELMLEFRAGELLDDWMKGRLFGKVDLTVWKCDPADPNGTRGDPLLQGYVQHVLPEGTMCTVKASLFGELLNHKAPGWVWGVGCNTYLTSPECALTEAAVKSDGTTATANLSADGMTLTVNGATGFGGPVYADQYFAKGFLRMGAARTKIVVTILESTTSGGNLVLKLARPLWPDMIHPVSQAVVLIPGCGGQYETDCGTKFGNQLNFRGHPFIPQYLEQVQSGQTPTAKK